MDEELKACPFCGGAARLDQRVTQSLWNSSDAVFSHVACDECDIHGQDFCDDPDGSEAIEWWNARAQLPSKGGGCRPLGYMNKKDIARLQDEITWDGSYLTVGIDHWAQWQEDTPYDHLQAIYTHPADQVADDLTMVKVSRELLYAITDPSIHGYDAVVTAIERLRALLNGGRA